MKLDFEVIKEIEQGNFPDGIHFKNNQIQVFSIVNGKLHGTPTTSIDYEEWGDTVFSDKVDILTDGNITNFEIDNLSDFGIMGVYRTNNAHKLLTYQFEYNINKYFKEGNIIHNINNSINNFKLTLNSASEENEKELEYFKNVIMDKNNNLLVPGTKVTFTLSLGDNEFKLGNFYIDQSNFIILSDSIKTCGKNLLGKSLSTQTLNELHEIELENIKYIIETLLQHGNLEEEQYLIEDTVDEIWIDFKPNMTILQALKEIFKIMINWKMEELSDETIVIGSPDYDKFTDKKTHNFILNEDVFFKDFVWDNMNVYNQVCVHNNDFSIMKFADVDYYKSWKTGEVLYVQVPDGMKETGMQEYANELANRLQNMGVTEEFICKLQPDMFCGDEVIISDEYGIMTIGLVIELEHKFGEKGFSTNFILDTKCKLGDNRILDFIEQDKDKQSSTTKHNEVGYE